MDETFRFSPMNRKIAMGCLPLFLAWVVATLYLIRTDPNIRHPVGFAILTLGVPSFMAALSAWLLVESFRSELTFGEGWLAYRGVFRETTIDLAEVTSIRWRTWPAGGSVVLWTESSRLALGLGHYDDEDRERIILHLRSAVPPEIETGWNFFAYRLKPFERRWERTKPGPDEVLVRRERWDGYFLPFLATVGLVGVVSWWITGELRFFAGLLVPLGLWPALRFTTPARGMVSKKLSASSFKPDGFGLLWGLVAIAGLVLNGYLRPGMKDLDPVMIAGMVAWFAVFGFETFLMMRRKEHRDREAADLAAKAGGERMADAWAEER